MTTVRRALLALSVVLLVLVPACASSGGAKESTLDRAKREGVIRVGFTNENPFGYVTADAKLTGEDVEVARAVFGKLGIQNLEGVVTEFAGLVPGLQASRFDAVTAGFFIKPARCEQVLFSEPIVCVGTGIVTAAGNPLNIHSYADMAANSQVRVGVLNGAYEETYAKTAGVPADRIVVFPDGPSGVAGVQSGRIDVLCMNALSAQTLVDTAKDPKIERALPFVDPVVDGKSVKGCGGIAFRQEDATLRDAFNAELAKIKVSGELLALIKPFGFSEGELPDLTTEQLCAK